MLRLLTWYQFWHIVVGLRELGVNSVLYDTLYGFFVIVDEQKKTHLLLFTYWCHTRSVWLILCSLIVDEQKQTHLLLFSYRCHFFWYHISKKSRRWMHFFFTRCVWQYVDSMANCSMTQLVSYAVCVMPCVDVCMQSCGSCHTHDKNKNMS